MTEKRVQDYMTSTPVTIREEAPLDEAWQILESGPFHHLPVLDASENLSGILSATDIENFQKLFSNMQSDTGPIKHNLTVRDVMTLHVKTIDKGTSIGEANDMLLASGIRALPVTEGGKIVGIISETDILRYYNDLYNS